MKIGYAYTEFGRSRGIARYAAALAEGAASRRHEVHFHCTHRAQPVPDSICFHHISVPRFPHALELATFAIRAQSALRASSYDLVHTHGDIPYGDIVTAQSCHRAGIIARQRVAAGHSRERNFGFADRVRLAIERRLYAGDQSRQVIAVSLGVKRELAEHYGVAASRCTVIPNGVDVNAFHPMRRATDGATVRRRLGIPAEAIVLILTANEFERKGLPVLLDALGMLGSLRPWLLVAGEGDPSPYREELSSNALNGRVVFTGSVDDIGSLYAASDVFVMPTYYEAFSLATLEAAASGLPLVVTRVNGTEDLVRENENGLFIEREADSVAAALRNLLGDQERIQQLGHRAHISAQAYAWPVIIDRVMELYRVHRGGGR